eukprot:8227971-Lingulodinium_polyedra.AAC.1
MGRRTRGTRIATCATTQQLNALLIALSNNSARRTACNCHRCNAAHLGAHALHARARNALCEIRNNTSMARA